MSFPVGFMWMEGRNDSPWYPTLRLFRPGGAGGLGVGVRSGERGIGGVDRRAVLNFA